MSGDVKHASGEERESPWFVVLEEAGWLMYLYTYPKLG
jgi:hypothetical protein